VRERISRLERELGALRRQRESRRRQRTRRELPILSIVGYTNAGKSTLLRSLTASSVLVADRMVATLDPTSRRLRCPRERDVIITDTVGFIRDLPLDLVRPSGRPREIGTRPARGRRGGARLERRMRRCGANRSSWGIRRAWSQPDRRWRPASRRRYERHGGVVSALGQPARLLARADEIFGKASDASEQALGWRRRGDDGLRAKLTRRGCTCPSV
jgi:hypothetical protein